VPSRPIGPCREDRSAGGVREEPTTFPTLAWSTFGPHPIGIKRFATVSSGRSFAQVPGAILGKQARLQNPDKTPMAGVRHEG
jgi:hypothetical protein